MSRQSNSKITNRYVSFVDQPFKNNINWLECKRREDGAEGLWRIHDELYDLSDFVDIHPGGKSWLTLTKGTDITEAFETHHLNIVKSKRIAHKYHVRRASIKRNVKFTFDEDGFYQTLKRRVVQHLEKSPKTITNTTNLYTDGLFLTSIVLSVLSTLYPLLIPITGIFMAFLVVSGHNYFHRRDNERMYYFNLTFLDFKEWRISHALSHHLFPNSMLDIELFMNDPIFCFLPNKKGFFVRYVSWMLAPFLYTSSFGVQFIKKIISKCRNPRGIFDKTDAIPLTLPMAMYFLGASSLGQTFLIWMSIICSCSFVFNMIGANAGHHHPEVFHDGDEIRENLDWGAFQLDTMIDRKDAHANHFMSLTNFGDHILHHLFPTLDHGYLKELYPIFHEMVNEFQLEARVAPFVTLIWANHLQVARIEPSDRLLLAGKTNKRAAGSLMDVR